MSKGGSVGSQGTTQQARGSFSGNSRPSYGGNQAGGLGSKGGSQSYQEPYRSPYGQGPSYSQHGMRSGFDGLRTNYQNPNLQQAMPTQLPSQLPFDYGNSTSTPSGGQMMMYQPPRRQEEAMTRGPRPMMQTQGPESFIGQGPSGTYQQFGDFSVGVEGPSITYGTPTPNFAQEPVSGDNNNAEASMRIGQVAPQQFSGGFGSKGGLMNQTGSGYRSGIGGFF